MCAKVVTFGVDVPGEVAKKVCSRENKQTETSRQVADWSWSGVTCGIRAWSFKVFLEMQINKRKRNTSTGCRLGLVWCYKRYQGLEPQGIPGGASTSKSKRKRTSRQLWPYGVGLELQYKE